MQVRLQLYSFTGRTMDYLSQGDENKHFLVNSNKQMGLPQLPCLPKVWDGWGKVDGRSSMPEQIK